MECPASSILDRLEKGEIVEPYLSELLDHINSCDDCLFKLNLDHSTINQEELQDVLHLQGYSQEEQCHDLVSQFCNLNSNLESSREHHFQSHSFFEGMLIDDFRLIRHISSGGMGVVYEAEQLSLKRRVALKVLSYIGPISDQQLQRFKNEALAAARLDHPHIVPILSVGEANGSHYLVMKLITGSNLSRVIDELTTNKFFSTDKSLPQTDSNGIILTPDSHSIPTGTTVSADHHHVPQDISTQDIPQVQHFVDSSSQIETERLSTLTQLLGVDPDQGQQYFHRIVERFIPVAQGLQYAHDRGIVHRDIKPSNLLIDLTGKIWISDFGVAKIEAADKLTATGGKVGTPRYMSPEQASGTSGLVDHRADVYSLGVTLYELLTLRPLYDVQQQEQIYLKIAEEEPLAPRIHNPKIPLDLETILLKSIQKDIADRYSSAGSMAADLRRFLNGEPVLAKRPSRWDISLKWIKRHKGFMISLLSVATVTFVAVLVLLTMLIIHNQRKQELLNESEQNLQMAMSAVDDMLSKVGSEKLKNLPGFDPIRRELLQNALLYYQQLISDYPKSDQLKLQTAKAYSQLGFIYYELGEFKSSEESLIKGIVLLQELLSKEPESEQFLHQLAESYDHLSLAIFFESKLTENWNDRSYPVRLKELAIRQRLVETYPENSAYHRELSHCYTDLGNAIVDDRQYWDEAEQYYRLAVSVLDSYDSIFPNDPADFELAHAHEWLGIMMNRRNNSSEARKHLKMALSINSRIHNAQPNELSARQELAQNHLHLASVDNEGDTSPESAQHLRQAIEIYTEILQEHPGMYRAHRPLGQCYGRAATQALSASRFEEAVSFYKKQIEVSENIRTLFPGKEKHSAWNYFDLAIAQWLNHNHPDARSNFLLAFENMEQRLNNTNHKHKAREHLAWAYSSCPDSKLHKPEKLLSLTELLLQAEPDNPNYHFMQGRAFIQLGQYRKAITALQKNEGNSDIIELNCGKLYQAMCYWHLGQTGQANAFYQEAHQWFIASDKGFSLFSILKEETEALLSPDTDPK